MKLPSGVLQTRDRYVAAFPLWVMEAGAKAEDRARKWTIGLASQIVFEHGATYGSKRADPTRPISKDAIAQMQGPYLYGWDMLTGAGSGAPKLVSNPDSIDLTGQYFEAVAGRDVISGADAPDGGEGGDGDRELHPYPDEPTWWHQFEQEEAACYAQAGQALNWAAFRWSSRTAYDIAAGLEKEAAKAKHFAEMRAELGLPPA